MFSECLQAVKLLVYSHWNSRKWHRCRYYTARFKSLTGSFLRWTWTACSHLYFRSTHVFPRAKVKLSPKTFLGIFLGRPWHILGALNIWAFTECLLDVWHKLTFDSDTWWEAGLESCHLLQFIFDSWKLLFPCVASANIKTVERRYKRSTSEVKFAWKCQFCLTSCLVKSGFSCTLSVPWQKWLICLSSKLSTKYY